MSIPTKRQLVGTWKVSTIISGGSAQITIKLSDDNTFEMETSGESLAGVISGLSLKSVSGIWEFKDEAIFIMPQKNQVGGIFDVIPSGLGSAAMGAILDVSQWVANKMFGASKFRIVSYTKTEMVVHPPLVPKQTWKRKR